MPIQLQPGDTDLLIPLAENGEPFDPYTVHTHYFGISVPEAGIGAFVYARYQPAFALSQGGTVIFRGLDNTTLLDADYHDYRVTMPWPDVQGNAIRLANGLTIEALEPGELLRVRYASPDGSTSFDVEQRAVTPLLARGHVVPGEEEHHDRDGVRHGGIEQFMHCTGELVLRGERHEVDCLAVRDRSWNQIRGEDPGGARRTPPVGWTPISFGEDLSFNATSIEAPDTDPAWKGVCDVPDGAPTHLTAWVVRDGEPREVVEVRRNVLEYHPTQYAALRQEVEAVDEKGDRYRFFGEALSMSAVHSWPNIAFHDSVYRWTDEAGRETHCTYQEIWYDDYQHAMKTRFGS